MEHPSNHSEPLRRTPLAERHERLGARLGAFAGWDMPIRYPEGILAEHQHTRSAASLFDICHMGEFRVRGATAAGELDRLCARRVVDQKPGTCRYNFLVTAAGTVRDDLLVYRLAADEFYLVVNAGTVDSDAAWLRQNLGTGTVFADESAVTAKLDLQGPRCFEVLADLGLPLEAVPPYFNWRRVQLRGLDVLLSRTGYTGERGVEIYVPADAVGPLWDALLAQPLVKPAGLGARDTLRLEMGYPLYGHELNLSTTPVEAGFERLVRRTGGDEFVGAAALAQPAARRLAGFVLEGRRAAREGARVWDRTGQEIGVVTSGAFGPSLGCAVALGYVQRNAALVPGAQVRLGPDPDAALPATLAALPFYTKGTARSDG